LNFPDFLKVHLPLPRKVEEKWPVVIVSKPGELISLAFVAPFAGGNAKVKIFDSMRHRVRKICPGCGFELDLESKADIIYKAKLASTGTDWGDEFLHVSRYTIKKLRKDFIYEKQFFPLYISGFGTREHVAGAGAGLQ
jgi:hypothetical protein